MTIGPFHFEAPNGAAPLASGVHAGLFRVPSSPAASNSLYVAKTTGGLYSDATTPISNPKRKRYNANEASTVDHWGMNMDEVANERFGNGNRASGGREIRYTLAGQIDTPSADGRGESRNMEDSIYSDVDYRRALGSKRTHDEMDSPLAGHIASNTQSRSQAPGWSKLALDTIGGVMGKVWEFCKAGAFRGFYAGGGTGYQVDTSSSHSHTQPSGQVWCNEHDIPTLPTSEPGLSLPPSNFPQSDYSPYYYEQETPESPPPAAKRRQISEPGLANDELRKNWVMVDPTDRHRPSSSPFISQASAANAPSPLQPRPPLNRRMSKPVSRLGVSSLGQRRHSGRISHAGGALLSNREPASFASPRSPIVTSSVARPSTPSRLPVPSSRPQSPNPNLLSATRQQSRIPTPKSFSAVSQRSHHRNQSTASNATNSSPAAIRLRMHQSTAHDMLEQSSPRLGPEAKRMAARRLEEEREADARMNDFNAKLQEMIRQGREALGTTVEVDGDIGGMDEMWQDE